MGTRPLRVRFARAALSRGRPGPEGTHFSLGDWGAAQPSVAGGRDLAKHAFRSLGVVGHHMIIAIFVATIVALFAVCMLIYRRSQVQVRFGILAKNASGGNYVISEVRELPLILRDKLRFGLVFTKRGPREFLAQVVHYLPERPRILEGQYKK